MYQQVLDNKIRAIQSGNLFQKAGYPALTENKHSVLNETGEITQSKVMVYE